MRNIGLKMPDARHGDDRRAGRDAAESEVSAGFSLQDVGGPPINEKPDATGLFSDGRFLDFSAVRNRSGRGGNFQTQEQNRLHSLSVSDDGERVYVAGTTAGFYILNSEGVAHHTDAELTAGTAGCSQRSTVVAPDNGPIDAGKLPGLAGDCLHMVINDDPGVKAFLASGASAQARPNAISC
jgi:hypothetical protein